MLAVRVRVEWLYNETLGYWEEQPEQILEVRPYILGTDPTTAESLSITQNYSSNNNYTEEYFYLAPIEVLQPGDGATQGSLTKSDRIRPCRWLDNATAPGDANILLPPFPEQDADRIVVRVALPHLTGQSGLTISISTEDEAEDETDAPTPINLVETPANSGVFESLPFVVVTDMDDDNAIAGTPGGADNALNDRTHLGQGGGTLVLASSAWGDGSVRVPIKELTHFVEVTSVILDITGDSLSVSDAQLKLNSQAIWMAQAYRPYGIEVRHTDGGVITVNATNKPDLYNVLTYLDPNTGALTIDPVTVGALSDVAIIFSDADVAALKTTDNMLIVYVNANFSNNAVGQAQEITSGFGGRVLMSAKRLVEQGQDAEGSNSKAYTGAHECGHIFGLKHYYEQAGGIWIQPSLFNLMRDGLTRWGRLPTDAGRSGRRLLREQLSDIFSSPYLKEISTPTP